MKPATVTAIACLTGLGAMVALCPSANAQQPQINYVPVELTPGSPGAGAASDVFTFTASSGLAYYLAVPENPNESPSVLIPTINGVPIPGNPGMVNFPEIWMDTPGQNGLVSDAFGVVQYPIGAGPVFALWSDSDTDPVTYDKILPYLPTGAIVTMEPVGPVDVSQYLDSGLGGKATFQSDAADGGTTAFLMGVALAGLGWVRRFWRDRA